MAPVIALGPDSDAAAVAAVEAGGGRLGPLEEADALVWIDPLAGDLPRLPARVRWLQLPSAGVERWIDGLPDGPVVTSMAGAYAQPVAEHALALILAALHRLAESARAGEWTELRDRTRSLEGTTVAIVGAGGIGRALIEMLAPLRCRVLAVTRRGRSVPGAERTVAAERVEEVLGEADVVVLAAPGTPGSRQLMDARRLAAMRPGARLVNVGRGSLVDTDALVAALASGHLGGAALDVTDPEPLPAGHPLWSHPNVLITPHTATAPEAECRHAAERIRANVERFAAGEPLLGVFDARAGY